MRTDVPGIPEGPREFSLYFPRSGFLFSSLLFFSSKEVPETALSIFFSFPLAAGAIWLQKDDEEAAIPPPRFCCGCNSPFPRLPANFHSPSVFSPNIEKDAREKKKNFFFVAEETVLLLRCVRQKLRSLLASEKVMKIDVKNTPLDFLFLRSKT